MLDFLNNLDSLEQGFWYVALITSAIFVVQTLLTFIGGHSADALNADFDGHLDHGDATFQLFSLRNLINFLLGFGWSGIAFYNAISNKAILLVLATVVGIIFIFIFFFLISQILKLTEDNTFKLESLKGKTGEVYINIPADKMGKGKILIAVNGATHELDAMTLSGQMIPSSTMVQVTEIENQLLLVTKI